MSETVVVRLSSAQGRLSRRLQHNSRVRISISSLWHDHCEENKPARQTHEAGSRYLLIDLGKIEMITSAGLGALHNIYKLFTPHEEVESWEKEKHGEPYKSPYFKIAGASKDVYYVLNIAGFLQNIAIYPDLDAALKSFSA